MRKQEIQRRHSLRFLVITLLGISMVSGCVIAPRGGYGYRVHSIHPAWRGGWRR